MLDDRDLEVLSRRLRAANEEIAAAYPGERNGRQPVHTVYGGAQIFKRSTVERLGELARRALATYAPAAGDLAAVVGIDDEALAERIHQRVRAKLADEPVEDFRIDFEDGYGNRSDDEEDDHARAAAREVARGIDEDCLSPFIGIRVKPLGPELAGRSLRTLSLFLEELLETSGGILPAGFVVTLPKISHAEQVAVLVEALARLEAASGLPEGSVGIELMIETPQSIFDRAGRLALPALVEAAQGRVVAAHFGTYDYTASLSVTAEHQEMTHPACDFARHVMQVALAGTGVWLSDGATNILPVAPHRGGDDGALTAEQEAENRAAVHAAWRLHYDHVQSSLRHAYYQGWDLHPAQLVTRYAAVYEFFLAGLETAGARLRNFVARAAQATLMGDVFDDAATGQGLLNYFARALNCGAIDEGEATESSGLTVEELRGRSFVRILEARRGAGNGA